ncbi:hypothetical protein [Chitinophaga vietnamensis]|uniref:hypothetical protein n=1 Tax=Chitinophaga vietnamensis TaxID=2593957 RepID=UPI001177807E|nr:hypothetical protein [Chitinophaga vietnamensis]
MKEIFIDVNRSAESWHQALYNNDFSNDYILFEHDQDKLTWFVTNYMQFLIRKGGFEVMPLYGRAIHDLSTFIYQANLSFPVSYALEASLEALYDLLLNFETEPDHRVIIWNDCDHLHQLDKPVFSNIFERMIVAAYCNRNAISTIKSDNTYYRVDQRNIFVFQTIDSEELAELTKKQYFIPSIIEQERGERAIDFTVIRLVDDL